MLEHATRRHNVIVVLTLIPRLHDAAGCQTGWKPVGQRLYCVNGVYIVLLDVYSHRCNRSERNWTSSEHVHNWLAGV